MKLKASFGKLLTNKFVLHIVCVIALINVLCYVTFVKLDALILFILIAIIIANFSRNMILILGIPLIFVNLFLLKESCMLFSCKEGFEEGTNQDASGNLQDASGNLKKAKNQIKQTLQSKKSNSNSSNSSDSDDDTEDFVGNSNGKNNNVKNKPKIDYASTVEEAYDNLSGILGGEGIQNLTKDTKKLMNQQHQLAETMKGMGPLLEGMGPLLAGAKDLLGGESFKALTNFTTDNTK
jgi:hypothetical protein